MARQTEVVVPIFKKGALITGVSDSSASLGKFQGAENGGKNGCEMKRRMINLQLI